MSSSLPECPGGGGSQARANTNGMSSRSFFRTDLCFAWVRGGYHAAMAEVPCEKVEHVLRNHCPVR